MTRIQKKIVKYSDFIITKIKLLWQQRVYKVNNVKVKYLFFEDDNSQSLTVVFNSCTRKGIKARYNYVRTLNHSNCNRLYILDDYGKDHRGSYYLGENSTFNEEVATKSLIDMIVSKINPRKIIFCGSSKGGYSALNFGLQYENSYIIAGAPQYYLYTYLKASGNLCTLSHIIGSEFPEKKDIIEYRLKKRICENNYVASQKLFLHYSDQEHTFREHVSDMLDDMKEKGYIIEKNIAKYTDHSEISYFFPDFLVAKIQDINQME